MTPDRVPSKYCRYCGRIIPMDTVNCPYCERNVIRMPGQKACPFCGEPIRAEAIKCRHCGEFVDSRQAAATAEGGQPPQQQPPVIYIDKAVIARSDESGELRIEGARPGVRLEPGSEEARRLLGEGREERGEASGALPGGPGQRALPPGEEAGLPVAPGKAPPPTRGKAPPLPAETRPKKPKKQKARKEEKAPPGQPPEARYECPSCRRYVYEGDNYCENCGRDLSIPAGRREFPGPSRAYRPADYALMVGTASPVGLLLGSGTALGIAAAGGALGAWVLYRTAGSQGERTGVGRALGALVAAAFWIIAIVAFAR